MTPPANDSENNLETVRQTWEYWGETDPLWAILSDPAKKGGRWDVETFFASGVAEIEGLVAYLGMLPIPLQMGRALDFGCGVGRLTQALAGVYQEAHGVDVSAPMVARASTINRYPERCFYHHNPADDLRLFPDNHFDLIYSNLVFQHIPPPLTKGYLAECLRILASGGVFVFQLPTDFSPSYKADQQRSIEFLPPRRLPRKAFRAQIEIQNPPPRQMAASERFPLTVRVRNLSQSVWAVKGSGSMLWIHLGQRWFDRRGDTLVTDMGERTLLPKDLFPDEEVDLLLNLTAPRTPGTYVVEIDLVQEFVAWFADRGSRSVRYTITVAPAETSLALSTPTPSPAADVPAAPEPSIPLYAIPRTEVEAILTNAGGRILDVVDSPVAGWEWVSVRYCVTK
ncbi:MAG TPA: class I SAM-dependent methyltransferase [Aggregatilineales bacterium]|nr:methyltransferase domain-containing protein [Anaerolineales bacterium]HRE49565.1 class I SAM-dependent methyltransferase [Aggregatilineales bacterium]